MRAWNLVSRRLIAWMIASDPGDFRGALETLKLTEE